MHPYSRRDTNLENAFIWVLYLAVVPTTAGGTVVAVALGIAVTLN